MAEERLMSFEVGKKALDFPDCQFRQPRQSGSGFLRRRAYHELAGGKGSGRIRTAAGKSECNKKFRFTLTTNGVLLNDEIMEFANKEMSNIVLSIDGRKEVNDAMRPFRGGQGSYDMIVPKFQEGGGKPQPDELLCKRYIYPQQSGFL